MSEKSEYGWKDSEAPNSAGFLDPVVLEELSKCAPPSSRIIELGSGNGAFAKKLVSLGYDVTAVEPSSDGVAQARRAAPELRVIQASVYDDLESTVGGEFDVVLSTEVIEHLTKPKELFARASELLKPGGTLILTTPYHGYLKNLAFSVLGVWDRHFHVHWEGGHIKFFSNQTLTKMARPYGFTAPRFRGAGRMPYLWKSTVMVAALR